LVVAAVAAQLYGQTPLLYKKLGINWKGLPVQRITAAMKTPAALWCLEWRTAK